MIPVDVIFLDIDGVLLPFGDSAAAKNNKKSSSQEKENKCEDCIFPTNTMNALTILLQKVGDISLTIKDTSNTKNKPRTIKGNPVLVLSSTWRARQEFISDILKSFRAYQQQLPHLSVQQDVWEPHLDAFFDLVDPTYHATRHDEIFSWVRENDEEGKNRRNNSKKRKRRRTPQELECTSTVIDFQVRSWIALDDEDLVNVEDGRVEEKAKKFAVKTESSIGLTLQDVDSGVKLLQDQIHSFYHRNNYLQPTK